MKFKTIFLIVMAVISVIGATLGIRALFFPVKGIEKAIDTAYGVLEETMDAENAIYNYEWFLQTEEDIVALYSKEERATESIKEFTETSDNSKEDKIELARLRSIKTGLSNMLDDTIAKYNARSKMANRAIFKDNLPSNISRAWLATRKLITK